MPRPSRICNQGIAERLATFETEPRTPEDIERVRAERGDRYPTIVVERDGEVVARAGAGSYRARPCYEPIAEHSVYVERGHRCGGVGRLALEALIAEAERRGFLKLVSRIFRRTWPAWHCTARWASARWASTAATASSTPSGATV
jgi:phosphinothricin acetyltransferase